MEARVCPRCGNDAGDHEYCSTCGLHLWEQPELPTRSEWETTEGSNTNASSEARTESVWWRRPPAILAGVAVVLVAVVGGIAAVTNSGSDNKSHPAKHAAPPPPPPAKDPATLGAEAEVLKMAQTYYPSQGITAVDCAKTGFTTGADIYSCTLTSPNLVTQPSDWDVYTDSSGNPIGASPSSAAGSP